MATDSIIFPAPVRNAAKVRPQDIDRNISARFHALRVASGLTQKQLADLLSLSFQQVFKYEKGVNRIPSATLYRMAEIFEIPVASFFEGWELGRTSNGSKLPDQRLVVDLVRTWRSIEDAEAREAVCAQARLLARVTQRQQERFALA
jgi:transcriptional regulator with XRE-family HTH domain